MANKAKSGSLFRPVTQPRPAPKIDEIEDRLSRDEHFRIAIQRGDTNGDVVSLDRQGNEIRGALSNKTIFDF